MVKTAIELVKVEISSFLYSIWQFYVRMGLMPYLVAILQIHINVRPLIKQDYVHRLSSAKCLLYAANVVYFPNGHSIVSSLICRCQHKRPKEIMDLFLHISKSELYSVCCFPSQPNIPKGTEYEKQSPLYRLTGICFTNSTKKQQLFRPLNILEKRILQK